MGGIARVDKEAFATGLAVGAHHRMLIGVMVAQVLLFYFFVGKADGRIDGKIVVRAQAAEKLLQRFGKPLIGHIHIAKQGVTPQRRNLDGIEQ